MTKQCGEGYAIRRINLIIFLLQIYKSFLGKGKKYNF